MTTSPLEIQVAATRGNIFGAIQVLRNAVGGGCQISWKKRYGGVRFNIISITRGWVGVKSPGKSVT